jgi:hypothetical protein
MVHRLDSRPVGEYSTSARQRNEGEKTLAAIY